MSRWLSPLPILLMMLASAVAQRPAIDPPVAGRPEDFSNIVGNYTIKLQAAPREVQLEEPITLEVRITGSGPERYQPKRKSLNVLPNWSNDFHVENVPDEDRVIPTEKTWLFVYRLRPKHLDVKTIDGIKLVYYDPESRGKNKFLQDYPEAIPITVTPRPDTTPPIRTRRAVPDAFYEIDTTADVLGGSTRFSLAGITLALFLIVPPLLCTGAALIWRRGLYPSRGAGVHRRALAQSSLDQMPHSTIPWMLVVQYLHDCHDFRVLDATPSDVAAFLHRRGFAKSVCERAREFFVACDAVRFASQAASPSLAKEGIDLIRALEADPCAR